MRNLAGKIYEFKAEDTGSIKDLAQRERILSNCMAPPLLTLKKGAQVMLIKNMDEQLVNGSVGLVAGFMTEPQFALYQENEALFYDESPDSSTLNITSQAVNDKLRAYGMGDAVADTGKLWPVVDFKLPDDSKRRLHVHPEVWKTELPNGEIQAQRKQVPLILAWSLSIHKAQGQTLPRVKVDLRKVFEKGQAYVALSRATCQEGLQVLNFDKRKVMAHRRVAEFYNSLYSVDSAAIQRSKMMSAYEFGRKGVTGVKEEVTRVKEEVKRVKEEVTRSRSTTHSFDSDEEEALAAMYG
jgi:ATP-dependent DNA helicase PIF1